MKRTYEEVKKIFADNGCELLSESYKDNATKMPYRCKCGNITKIRLCSFLKGHLCRRCGVKKSSPKRLKHTLEEVREYFLKSGCELLEDEYNSCAKLMKYRCNCGIISKVTFYKFKKGCRCKKCGYEKVSLSQKGENSYWWNQDRLAVEEYKLFYNRSRKLVRNSLEALGTKKQNKTDELLGYTPYELQRHMQKHPNWKQVKDADWHIDHIFPVKAFIEHGVKDLKIINSLDNLQPLSKSDNLSKRDKYDPNEFINWLGTKIT